MIRYTQSMEDMREMKGELWMEIRNDILKRIELCKYS